MTKKPQTVHKLKGNFLNLIKCTTKTFWLVPHSVLTDQMPAHKASTGQGVLFAPLVSADLKVCLSKKRKKRK